MDNAIWQLIGCINMIFWQCYLPIARRQGPIAEMRAQAQLMGATMMARDGNPFKRRK